MPHVEGGQVRSRIVLTQGLYRQIRLWLRPEDTGDAAAACAHRNTKLGAPNPRQWRNLTDGAPRGMLPQRNEW